MSGCHTILQCMALYYASSYHITLAYVMMYCIAFYCITLYMFMLFCITIVSHDCVSLAGARCVGPPVASLRQTPCWATLWQVCEYTVVDKVYVCVYVCMYVCTRTHACRSVGVCTAAFVWPWAPAASALDLATNTTPSSLLGNGAFSLSLLGWY